MATTAMGLVGRKCGMTRVFTPDGKAIPVTVLEVTSQRVTQVKTKEKHGYAAVVVTTGSCSSKKITKPLAGYYTETGVEAGRGLWEFRIEDEAKDNYKVGMELKVDLFTSGQKVDVRGITKGKGFAGVVKRWGFGGGDATHGCSLSHRTPGSIGQRQTPGRVFKGKKMAGHMGSKMRTIQSQEIVRVDVEKNILLVHGAVPGAPGSNVIIKPAIKEANKE